MDIKKQTSPVKRFIEISFVMVVASVLIMAVFGILNFGFKYVRKSFSGNVIVGGYDSIGDTGWIIITILTGLIVFMIIKFLMKKEIFSVKFN